MSNFKDFINVFNEIEGDFRGEVLAAELINNGLPFDSLFFKARSTFRRSTNKDIETVSSNQQEGRDDQVVIELNREGLYDMLPEGLFHFKNDTSRVNDKEAILKEIKKTRKEQAHARKFFETFENEFFHRRLQLELQERALLDPGSYKSNQDLFYSLFGDAVHPGNHQVVALLNILPLMFHIRGDIEKVEYCLCEVLRFNIKINLQKKYAVDYFVDSMPGLGEAYLGVDTIAGKSFKSNNPVYNINILDISKTDMPSFFENGDNYILLNYLLSYLLAAGAGYEVCLQLKEEDKKTFLMGENNCTYLNYDSYI